MAGFRYLLDTNVLSDLLRNPGGRVFRRVSLVGEATVCTSIVVACELRYGAAKKGSARLSERVERLLESLEVLPLERESDRRYAEIRTHLDQQGKPIGPNDLLIAAHALALDLVLVSANVDEFTRVPGLQVENWLVS
ncbi:MAG TPA: type II toxin-antitoxin system VapC family toxin [Thermoanaerobaculia bacterium]|jgi:tRNA(fMet)-specific endonuclease VapC|nr:type II toxin-antitoxin system VapC family toxin [Thermoanaerobaculia bacterium]